MVHMDTFTRSFTALRATVTVAAFSKSPDHWEDGIPAEYRGLFEIFENRPQGSMLLHRGDIDTTIDMIGDGPLHFSTLFNITEEELNALDEMITEQLAKEFIASSTAHHCAPVFFVETGGEGTSGKQQKLRLVVHYRELNR